MSSWPDLVNAVFQVLGIAFILLSILKLRREKIVRGVSWMMVAFFMFWDIWNLFYYPHLEQWLSFWGGIGIMSANTVWLAQLVWYTLAERRLATAKTHGTIKLQEREPLKR